ncbi:MAG: hypothetical protein IT393_02955 [Nitrospirae bacterium]|nr:hypothetical protein [Nitrospirota bacterium]
MENSRVLEKVSMLRKCLIGSFVILLFSVVSALPSNAWLIYHKPAFRGKVIDAETRKPIAGAVVVTVYEKSEIRLAPESNTAIKDIREVLTAEDGGFLVPSYTSITDPLSFDFTVTFIIFKPGYGAFPDWRINPPRGMNVHFEEFFSGEVGVVKDVWVTEPWKIGAEPKPAKVTFGVVELPKLKTREERRNNIPSLPTVLDFLEKQKNLIRLINEEEESLGLDKSDPYKAREFILKMGRE